MSSIFTYRSIGRLQCQCMILSLPQLLTGYICIVYLELEIINYKSFYVGLVLSLIFSPLMVQVTRWKLIIINYLMIFIGIIGLSIHELESILIFKIFTLIIGVIVGCDWCLTIQYIKEQVGWKEPRSIFLHNNPYLFFFFGSMLRISFQKKKSLEEEQLIVSCIIIFTNSVRLLSMLIIFSRQSLELYYRRFQELQGRVIIKEMYQGNNIKQQQKIHLSGQNFLENKDIIKEIEYFYISNNESNSILELQTFSLFQAKYRSKFISFILLQIFSWLQLDTHIFSPKIAKINTLAFQIPIVFATVIITPILLKLIKLRLSLILVTVIMFIINILQLMKIKVQSLKEHEMMFYAFSLTTFIIYFISLNMTITQCLPYKGIAYCLNLTFLSLLLSCYLDSIMETYHQKELNYTFTISNLLSFALLMYCYQKIK